MITLEKIHSNLNLGKIRMCIEVSTYPLEPCETVPTLAIRWARPELYQKTDRGRSQRPCEDDTKA